MGDYPTGNSDVLKMIENGSFDSSLANALLRDVDLNTPICDLDGYSTTYLYEAVIENNLPAVKYLLEHGADPNLNNPELIGDCAIWKLQYIEKEQDWKTRYEISKLFFQFGADPNIECEGETLYDYIVFKVYNDTPCDENDWENLRHLYKLLVIYGGGNDKGVYGRPKLKGVDRDKADDYDVVLRQHEDGYHLIGRLVDKNGKVVGEL